MSDLDELTRPLTAEEIKAFIYASIAAQGVTTTSWKPGAVTRTMIAGVAIVLAAVSVLISLIARSGFLELSEGVWLTLCARYIYNTERIPGTFGAGVILATNASGGIYTLDPGDLIASNSTTGVTYRNTETVTIGALASNVPIAVAADVLGSAGTALVGQIDGLVTPLIGVTVTNAGAIVGVDEESDEALRSRAQERSGSLSPFGPPDAYRFFARSAKRADGTAIGVTRVKLTPDGYGGIEVLVASASGFVSGTQGDPGTDLGAIHATLERNAVPKGITLTTASATALSLGYAATLWVNETLALDDDQITAAVNGRLSPLVSSMPIGGVVLAPADGKVYVQALEAAVTDALPKGTLLNLTTTTPAADLDVTSGQAPVFGGPAVLLIHRVAS